MNKTALITGSTSGIGKALAEAMAKRGYNTILVSRNKDKLHIQTEQLSADYHIRAQYIAADLAQPSAADYVFSEVQKLGLIVNVLINNAGFNVYGTFSGTNITKELEMISLHISCTTAMMNLFIPMMAANGSGYILNLGSTGSFMPCPNDAVYAATKAYILSLSRAVNSELKGTGVSVTALCPGSTNTEFAVKSGMEQTLLFKHFVMKPQDVAEIGCRAMLRRRELVVPGLYNKLLVICAKLLPGFITTTLAKCMLK